MKLLVSQSFVFIRTNGFIKNPGVGGTKQLNFDIIHRLKPDLIIANKEENVKKQAEELANGYPVWTSPVNNLQDAYEMIEQTGLLTIKQRSQKR
jgi:ABC-type Fe3+-hydroxamate transport system substrate-binding protein